jgi:hypothetical protein
MIMTRNDARNLIRAEYGDDFAFRICAASVTVGVRPVCDPRRMLAWQALTAGRGSAVRVGVIDRLGKIDWDALAKAGAA